MNKSRAKELLELNQHKGYLIRDEEGIVPSYPRINKSEETEVKIFAQT